MQAIPGHPCGRLKLSCKNSRRRATGRLLEDLANQSQVGWSVYRIYRGFPYPTKQPLQWNGAFFLSLNCPLLAHSRSMTVSPWAWATKTSLQLVEWTVWSCRVGRSIVHPLGGWMGMLELKQKTEKPKDKATKQKNNVLRWLLCLLYFFGCWFLTNQQTKQFLRPMPPMPPSVGGKCTDRAPEGAWRLQTGQFDI